MKLISIYGDNRIVPHERERVACRGIVIEGSGVLVSYASAADIYMIPGGGLEEGESLKECYRREIEEETGRVVEAGECFLEIDEYYGDYKFISYYFPCRVVGEGKRHFTEAEMRLGMKPVVLDTDKLLEVLSTYGVRADTDEEAAGIYLREFTALTEYFDAKKTD